MFHSTFNTGNYRINCYSATPENLDVTISQPSFPDYYFEALPTSDRPCSFSYENKIYQVQLGFATSLGHFFSYDKGLNPLTGKAIWGAILGAYRFTKF